MKKFSIIFFVMIIALTACKKYPQGGFVNQTRLHLFVGHKVGDSKTWKLKLYEVNGIDSTYLIQGANTIPDFYEKFVTFTYVTFTSGQIITEASTFTQNYSGHMGYKKEYKGKLILGNKFDSPCKTIDNINYCQRNIFNPEGPNSLDWTIQKLTKTELILNSSRVNSYKIILTQ